MAKNETKPTEVSVSTFIDAIEDEGRRADAKKLIKLMQSATGEKPKMWGPSIVGFGTHHYKYESGREGDMPIACFSPRKSELVLYSMMNFDGADTLLSKLGKHKTGKGCVYIRKLEDVNQSVLSTLLKKAAANPLDSVE